MSTSAKLFAASAEAFRTTTARSSLALGAGIHASAIAVDIHGQLSVRF